MGEQLRNSDSDINVQDDTYRPELAICTDNLNQRVDTPMMSRVLLP